MKRYWKSFIYKFRRALLPGPYRTPKKLALGLGAGIFCGCFPLFGFQTFLGIAMASILRGNMFFAALGTWISNPITYIPLYWFNYKIGSLILRSENEFNISSESNFNQIWSHGFLVSTRLFLGCCFVGIVLSGLFSLTFYFLLLAYQRPSKPTN